MADLNQALFRIDPTEGLLQYVQAIKPYHSKVLDVFVEYVYTEPCNISMKERLQLQVGLEEPVYPILYSCGFGLVWSPYSDATPAQLAQATIVSSQAPVSLLMNSNSFLVSMAPQTAFNIVVANTTTNQFVLARPYTITNVNVPLKQFTVTGPIIGPVGSKVYVRNNADSSTNKEYTVASVLGNVITVVESVSLTATISGTVNIPVDVDDTAAQPFYAAGTAIQLQSTGTLPTPVQPLTTYYFHPTATPGLFNLGTIRYPQQYTDIVNLTSLGTGQLTMRRVEPFVPGDSVNVTGTIPGGNDGLYIISAVTAEGANFRIHTLQTVPNTAGAGGSMVFFGDYGSPYCAVASSPDLFVSSYFHEDIEFVFGPMPVQPYLYDTFSGTGSLNGYTNESGHTWNIIQMVDSLDELVRNGEGQLVTSDVDIWAASNWTLPSPTFFVEVELFVKAKPVSSSPYFRLFAKEAGVGFLGPYVDIRPDDVTGMILVDARNGNLANLGLLVNTGVPVDQMIKVRLRVVGGNTLQVLVNGVVVYTSGAIVWPALTRVGFNYTVPAGDPTQFLLNKVLGNT